MHLLLVLFFLFPVFTEASNKAPLRAGVPITLPPPLLFLDQNTPQGILPEFISSLAQILGREHSVLALARPRIPVYLEKGKLDFFCYTIPAWSPIKDKLTWSAPLFLKREIIVGPAPLPKSLDEFKGVVIGTSLDYTYPNLNPYFQDKSLVREDAPTDEANLKKLLSNRVSYVVIDEVFFDYFKNNHPEIEEKRQRLLVQEYPIACAISPHSKLTKKEFDGAVQKLKTSKKLEALFKKYNLSVQVL